MIPSTPVILSLFVIMSLGTSAALGQLPEPRVPVQQSTVVEACHLLRLNPDQTDLVMVFFKEYREQWRTRCLPEARSLTERAQRLARQAMSDDPAAAEQAVDHVDAYERDLAALDQTLESLEQSFFSQVQSVLHDTQTPEVHPDPLNAGQLYDQVSAFPDLTQSQRNAVQSLRITFQSEHDSRSAAMRDAIMDRRLALRAFQRDAGRRAYAAEQELLRLGHEREALNLQQRTLLVALLTPEQAARLPVWEIHRGEPAAPSVGRKGGTHVAGSAGRPAPPRALRAIESRQGSIAG